MFACVRCRFERPSCGVFKTTVMESASMNVLLTGPAAIGLAVVFASSALADFVSPTLWVRGSNTRSTYQGWDIFSSVTGPNAPNSPNVPAGAIVDAAPFNPNGAGDVLDTSGVSFLT